MIEYMEQMKANRLARERAALILVRKGIAINILRSYKISQLPFTSVMPEPYDFGQFPAIKEVIEQSVEINVDESSFAEVVPLLPGIFDEWRADIHKKLVKNVRIDGGSENENSPSDEVITKKINLATTVFRCSRCSSARYRNGPMWDDYYDSDSEFDFDFDLDGFPFFDKNVTPKLKTTNPLFYPNVLAHRCLTKPSGWCIPSVHNDPTVILDALSAYRKEWSCEDLVVDKSAGKIVKSLVNLCGLDPASATVGDMDELDARFVCTLCNPRIKESERPITVLTRGWREAVRATRSIRHLRLTLLPMLRSNTTSTGTTQIPKLGTGSPKAKSRQRLNEWIPF
jgi:hypothetical protein